MSSSHSGDINASVVVSSGGSVTINGVTYGGRNIQIKQGRVFVDNVYQGADVVGSVTVAVNGFCESASTGSGDIIVNGSANSVVTGSGDVQCSDVRGSVSTASGDVSCKAVYGNISTASGDISKRIF